LVSQNGVKDPGCYLLSKYCLLLCISSNINFKKIGNPEVEGGGRLL
jgi:hypothetical protein